MGAALFNLAKQDELQNIHVQKCRTTAVYLYRPYTCTCSRALTPGQQRISRNSSTSPMSSQIWIVYQWVINPLEENVDPVLFLRDGFISGQSQVGSISGHFRACPDPVNFRWDPDPVILERVQIRSISGWIQIRSISERKQIRSSQVRSRFGQSQSGSRSGQSQVGSANT